jgi:hypothetical protein
MKILSEALPDVKDSNRVKVIMLCGSPCIETSAQFHTPVNFTIRKSSSVDLRADMDTLYYELYTAFSQASMFVTTPNRIWGHQLSRYSPK